ncbi:MULTISPECIES: ABC transporter ATP-binding protein [Grimontia]|nr:MULTISPECIES: ABC transporter ATP-binding protein [Grimontia]WRW00797.1 ABC transporter ATP-binding protein [Grimontia sp. NTOU-MAR1]
MKGTHQPILSLADFCADSLSGWRAVSDVTFSVSANECIAVIGPNGSGKSSLLKAITGEYRKVAGELWLEGCAEENLNRLYRAKRVAVVAQHEHVDPRLSVSEYVGLGRVPHTFCCTEKEHQRAVKQAIHDTGLSAKENRLFGSLSGGEKQRASIARAFAQEPKLLLLDEPTNHLDPLARLELLDLIKQRGIASIAVLHDLPLVAPFADKVILMSGQKMVTCASPNEVLQDAFITPVFGLRVFPLSHPQINNTVHHFEAAPSH